MKNLWPIWFPYPSSWLRTIVLCIFLAPLAHLLDIFGRIGLKVAQGTSNPGPFMLMVLLSTIAPFILMAYLHHFIFIRKTLPGWHPKLPSPQSIWQAFFGLSILVINLLILLTVVCFIHDMSSEHISDGEAVIYTIVWFFGLAYFYQIEYLGRRAIAASHPGKPYAEAKTPRATASDSVDLELEKLKKEIEGKN